MLSANVTGALDNAGLALGPAAGPLRFIAVVVFGELRRALKRLAAPFESGAKDA